ncbi:MAG: ASCH domain-containing protein [Alphaproteobacteria bacterium]
MKALSIRQPWAWAIIHAGKDIENRSTFAITKGAIEPKRIAVHAAKGMTRKEYEQARGFMATLGVECPPPAALIRGAVIGHVDVVAIVHKSTSPWFFGPRGLVLRDPTPLSVPVPGAGALGYFDWKPSLDIAIAPPLPWMTKWATPTGGTQDRHEDMRFL